MSGPVDVIVEDLHWALAAERKRADDLWQDLQGAYRALAVRDDECRDLRAEVERLTIRLAVVEARQP